MRVEIQGSVARFVPPGIQEEIGQAFDVWPRDESGFEPAAWESGLRTLAGGVAHKFNNLLTVVLGCSTLIRQQLPAESPLFELVDLIEAAGTNGEALTRQMLLYARNTSPRIELVDLADAICDLDPHFRANVADGVAVEYDVCLNLQHILADPGHLRRTLLSLFANASEAIGEGPGRIDLHTDCVSADRVYQRVPQLERILPPGQYAWLQISDTGCGMDDITAQHVFEPFFTTKFTGRGLGLSAALGMVRRHQGALWLTTKPGRGTTAHVLWPCTGHTLA
jgi:two-component system, cell cycle sensor histidine kinase and response regulator CckA